MSRDIYFTFIKTMNFIIIKRFIYCGTLFQRLAIVNHVNTSKRTTLTVVARTKTNYQAAAMDADSPMMTVLPVA